VNYKGPICIESFTLANKTMRESAPSGAPCHQTQDELRRRGSRLAHLLDESRVDEARDAKLEPASGPHPTVCLHPRRRDI